MRNQRLCLRLGGRHVLFLQYDIKPTIAAVIAFDSFHRNDLFKEFKRWETHRAQFLHAAIEP